MSRSNTKLALSNSEKSRKQDDLKKVSDHLPPHLKDLNPEQLEAARHGDGPLLIFAGAGSGKTRVLTRRIANLVLEHRAAPEEILAVTFTNKAAREMKERVAQLFSAAHSARQDSVQDKTTAPGQRRGVPHGGVPHGSAPHGSAPHGSAPHGSAHHSAIHLSSSFWVSTFHSTCVRILRRHADLLGYTNGFAIYDSKDSMSLLKNVYKKYRIDPKIIDPKTVSSRIDRAKNNYECPETMREKFGREKFGREKFSAASSGHWSGYHQLNHQIADLYQYYQQELRTSNAMDFGDLLCNALTLFKLEPVVLRRYQQQFRYLLVDEYQDTNRVQYMLIQMLTGDNRNLCVVGDDDQSIYAFRGATIENILNFKKDFPDAKVITLDQNYRSTQTILEAANAVIAVNQQREIKTMRTENPRGQKIVLCNAFDEKDEARFVAEEILNLRKEDSATTTPPEIAVFYRTNAQSRAIEEAFCAQGIPYQIFGGHRFYDRKEIKDMMAYFRLLLNPSDNEAFLRTINTPARGIGTTSVSQLVEFAQNQQLALLPALASAVQENNKKFSSAALKKFSAFLQLISTLTKEAQTAEQILTDANGSLSETDSRLAIAELLQKIAEKSGYIKQLKDQDTPEAQSRIENIVELYGVAVEFVSSSIKQGHIPSLCDFLDRASLSSDLEQENTKADSTTENESSSSCVSMMTLHLAKGLEFDIVFLVGLEEGLLPHSRSLDELQALEEERRLCYVGITRAMKNLYLSYAEQRSRFGRNNSYGERPSRFLQDLPEECLTYWQI